MNATQACRGRVVALPINGEGHISPMMHLCDFLAKVHNFAITLVLLRGSINNLDSILRKGCWPPSGLDVTLVEIQGKTEPPPRNGKVDLALWHEYMKLNFPDSLKKLLRELDCVDCLVCDYQLSSWVIDVAEELNIPGAILFTGSVTWSWFELNMPWLVSFGNVPMQESEFEARDGIPKEQDFYVMKEPVTLKSSDIPWHFWNDRKWQEYTVKYNSNAFRRACWVLVSSCEELEPEITKSMKQVIGDSRFLPVGPLFLLNDHPTSVGFSSFDPKCVDWLDRQPTKSVIYIAFGSLAKLSFEQLEEFGEGLAASKHKFLWVARNDEDEKITDFYRSFAEKNTQQGLITFWAPQTQVLSHTSVGAFVSHCGWNSTIEGVSSSQVIVCWPCLFDQNLNRKLIVEEWKVGFEFEKVHGKVVDRKEVERVVRLAMEGNQSKETSQRVKDLSGKVRTAVTAPDGSSMRNLEKFVQGVIKKKFTI